MAQSDRWTATGVRIDDDDSSHWVVENRQTLNRSTGEEVEGVQVVHRSTHSGDSLCEAYRGTPLSRAKMLDARQPGSVMCEECVAVWESHSNGFQRLPDGGGAVGVGMPAVQPQTPGVGVTSSLLAGHVEIDAEGNVQLSPWALAGGAVGVALLAGLVGAWLA